ncbi:MAG: XRE family transcriptional regulator [Rhodocyclales bacterium]|nr:XRE family transcriptional regulator [Rhodocyclales bacterium]
MIPTYSPDALRAVLARHALTGSAAGRLLAVDSRTIRKWTAAASINNHRDMPESAWWLLLILTGDITVDDLKTHLQIGAAE